jgi:hypothetical protein
MLLSHQEINAAGNFSSAARLNPDGPHNLLHSVERSRRRTLMWLLQ